MGPLKRTKVGKISVGQETIPDVNNTFAKKYLRASVEKCGKKTVYRDGLLS